MFKNALDKAIYAGLILSIVFLLLHLPKKKRPVFNQVFGQVIALMLSSLGVIFALDCGYVTLTASPANLGVLANYKFPVILGTIAWLYFAVEKIIEIFSKLLTYQKDQENDNPADQ